MIVALRKSCGNCWNHTSARMAARDPYFFIMNIAASFDAAGHVHIITIIRVVCICLTAMTSSACSDGHEWAWLFRST